MHGTTIKVFHSVQSYQKLLTQNSQFHSLHQIHSSTHVFRIRHSIQSFQESIFSDYKSNILLNIFHFHSDNKTKITPLMYIVLYIAAAKNLV